MCEVIVIAVGCLLAADFLTGLGHWLEDTYALPTMAIIGKAIAEPNIDHHRNPGLLGSMTTLISRSYQLVLPAIGLSVVAAAGIGWRVWPIALTLLLASLGNEVHAWSHRSRNPAWIVFLQNIGLAQSPRQHAKHHRRPYDRYYCTLTNVTNELLEVIRFWRGLEWLLDRGFGLRVKRLSAERDGF